MFGKKWQTREGVGENSRMYFMHVQNSQWTNLVNLKKTLKMCINEKLSSVCGLEDLQLWIMNYNYLLWKYPHCPK